ncbi:MAG TPA: tyrosine-type recombinase/integrase [bacterium]|nr:tyrosine-type recombinase/integrase [bacterium]HQL63813.1 tyrosine-type recombinase/integrase [bacterium]
MKALATLNNAMISTRIDDLPPHITFAEYLRMRETIENHWQLKETPKSPFYQRRDMLFIDLLWATGARVDDLCHLPVNAVNFTKRQVRIDMKKSKRVTIVTLDEGLLLDLSRFISDFDVKGALFGFTRFYAYKMVKQYANEVGIEDIHPHKFRHGLAIHLLQQGVPIPVISARLGHASVYVTMSLYMKVTPEIQAEMVKHVKWR